MSGENEASDVPVAESAESPTTPSEIDVADKSRPVCIITGANSGIGYITAEMMAGEKGFEVIMACRDEEKGVGAAESIKKKYPEASATFMQLDLASLDSIKAFVEKFRALEKPLNVLCLNAGVYSHNRETTRDGFELTLGTNHLGHFLLTHLLLDLLKRTGDEAGEARIVVTASMVHNPKHTARGLPAHLDFDNLQLDKPNSYSGQLAYRTSKLANVIFTKEMAQRLQGTNVTCNSVCPGFIPDTKLLRNLPRSLSLVHFFVFPMLKWRGITSTVQQGAEALVYMATSPELKGVNGKFYRDFAEKETSAESNDANVGSELWKISEQLVGSNNTPEK